jgi:thiamine-phosphate pyrophosphorylase
MPGRPSIDFNLYLISDRAALAPGKRLTDVVHAACAAGVRAVQLREKDLSARELFQLAGQLRNITHVLGARLLINDRIDVALAVDADGVHLSGNSLPVAVARRLLGPDRLLALSTHHLDEILVAHRDGADFVTFGPVFATPSKAAYGAPQGFDALRRACAASSLPVFALGGIDPHNLPQVLACGAQGAAMIRAIITADDPAAKTTELLDIMKNAP